MTKPAARLGSIFASKGEAIPAPAVAYVGLRQLQGRPERRKEEPTKFGPPDQSADRAPAWKGTNRRHFPPEDDFGKPPELPAAAAPATSPLSSLIARHRVPRASPPPPLPREQTPPAQAASRVEVAKYTPTPVTHELAPTQSEPVGPLAKRIKRKKLTVRLERDIFQGFKDLAYRGDCTYQSILEAAIRAYLDRSG